MTGTARNPWGRDFVNRRYASATAKNAAEAERVKQGGLKREKTILCGAYDGDPTSIDWMNCNCGYQPPTSGGKKVPQRLDPAWTLWVEQSSPTPGKKSLHKEVKSLVTEVYVVNKVPLIGYHHNVVPLGTHGGYPDLTLWGNGRPGIMWREEKAMRGAWEPGQREHLFSLHQKGFDVGVWKPCCLLSGRIDLELAQLAGVPPKGRGAQRLKGTLYKRLTWEGFAAALDEDDH